MDNTQGAAPAIADNAAQPPVATAQITAPPAPSSWRDSLSPELRDDPSLKTFSDLDTFAKGYVNLKSLLGAEKVPRPKGDFDPADPQWSMFLDAAGRPKSADEYKFEEAKLPDGMPYDTNLEGKFKEVAHMAGLNGKQAAMMRDMFVAYQAETYESSLVAKENDANARRDQMMKEMGDAYEPLKLASEKAQIAYIPDALAEKIKAAGLHRDPDWIRALGKIGMETLKEDPLKGPLNESVNTPADWKVKADEYRSQYASVLFNNQHPDHKRRTDEYTAMFQKAFPS